MKFREVLEQTDEKEDLKERSPDGPSGRHSLRIVGHIERSGAYMPFLNIRSQVFGIPEGHKGNRRGYERRWCKDVVCAQDCAEHRAHPYQ